jgi:hypothetical protein
MVIRLLDLRQFDCVSKRFRDTHYRHSSKPADPASTPDGRGGISVVLASCACPTLECDCFCAHISRYYDKFTPEPCAFVQFELDIFTKTRATDKDPELVDAPTGDPCHRNLHNVSDNQFEKKLRTPSAEPDMRFCVDGHCELYSADRAIELVNAYYPDPE